MEATDPGRKPRLVIGHDTRHFSRDFAEFCAKIGTDLGCDIYLFDSPRATPEISFAIRELHADSGVVLTASHNPPMTTVSRLTSMMGPSLCLRMTRP